MRLLALMAICLLVGCSDTTDHALKRMSRKEKLSEVAAKAPSRAAYQFAEGQLLVLDITTLNGSYVDSQKCYVWRDAELKTASLQCPSQGEMPVLMPDTDKAPNY